MVNFHTVQVCMKIFKYEYLVACAWVENTIHIIYLYGDRLLTYKQLTLPTASLNGSGIISHRMAFTNFKINKRLGEEGLAM